MAVTLGSIAAALLGFAGVAQRGQGPSHKARCCTGVVVPSCLCASGTRLDSARSYVVASSDAECVASTCMQPCYHALNPRSSSYTDRLPADCMYPALSLAHARLQPREAAGVASPWLLGFLSECGRLCDYIVGGDGGVQAYTLSAGGRWRTI